ncbi:hypothetical protein [Roseimaritima ulvae]|uniref:PEP-CTERM protein-sorting domain-containing protein n=1 Tax=Roseimaritima ulvae TaxID=980254 RepID=A0A5B9QTT9_9BACT|nr:hypothetical protein [Roseimaritima ulvae]QEG42467.1 hypothetical protein UC8_45060 [Roseimaritima ulvae]
MSFASARAGIIEGTLDPDIGVAFVSADYVRDSGTGVLRLLGNIESKAGIVRGVFDPADPNGLYPSGNVTVAGVNIPRPMGSGMPIPAGAAGLFRLDAFFDAGGNFTGGTFLIEGAHSPADSRVTLLKGTITEMDDAAFNSSGNLEFLGTSTIRDDSLADFGPVGSLVGIKFNSGASANTFSWIADFSTMFGTADVGRPVPEPASLTAFASVLAIGCCGTARRRRKQRLPNV